MQLHIVRHGKANPYADKDFDRTLHPLGIKQSLYLNEYFTGFLTVNCIVHHSSAARTTETAELITKNLDCKILHHPEMYGADFMVLFKLIELTPKTNHLIIVAHNPGVSRLIEYLTHERIYCKTGSLTSIEFDINEWTEISANTGKIIAEKRYGQE